MLFDPNLNILTIMKILKADNRSHIKLATDEKKYSLSSILVDGSSSKDFFIHHEIVEPGIQTSTPHFHQNTDEFVYVLKGTVTAHEGKKTTVISEGDSILFKVNSKKIHFIENTSDKEAEILVVKRSLVQNDVKYSLTSKKKKFEGSATTSQILNTFTVKNKDGTEKFIQLTYCSRLFKLATFIFHIFDLDPKDSEFEFSFLKEGIKSYGGYSYFKLPKKNTAFPPDVGNIRHGRIDSAFFPFDNELVLKVDGHPSEQFIIKCLGHDEPKPRRKYPYEVKSIDRSQYPQPLIIENLIKIL